MSQSKGGDSAKKPSDEKQTPTDDEKKVYIRNKFNPSANEIQRQQMEELLKRPDAEIVIPRPQKRTLSPPPELVSNIAGSSAGAGSGEFHVYKQARRKEFERMKMFEEEEHKEQTEKDFALQKSIHDQRDQAKTEKNRLKRLKRRGGGNKGKSVGLAEKTSSTPSLLAGSKALDAAVNSDSRVDTPVEDSDSPHTPAVPVTEPKGLEIVDTDF